MNVRMRAALYTSIAEALIPLCAGLIAFNILFSILNTTALGNYILLGCGIVLPPISIILAVIGEKLEHTPAYEECLRREIMVMLLSEEIEHAAGTKI